MVSHYEKDTTDRRTDGRTGRRQIEIWMLFAISNRQIMRQLVSSQRMFNAPARSGALWFGAGATGGLQLV